MTIKELIKELSKYPEYYDVYIKGDWSIDDIIWGTSDNVCLESSEIQEYFNKCNKDLDRYAVEYECIGK